MRFHKRLKEGITTTMHKFIDKHKKKTLWLHYDLLKCTVYISLLTALRFKKRIYVKEKL